MKRLIKRAIAFSNKLDLNQQQEALNGVKEAFLSSQLNPRGVNITSGNDNVECLMNIHLQFEISTWDFNAALSQLFVGDPEVQNKIKESYSQTVNSISDTDLTSLNMTKEQYIQFFNESLDQRVTLTRGSILNKEGVIKDNDGLIIQLYIPSAIPNTL